MTSFRYNFIIYLQATIFFFSCNAPSKETVEKEKVIFNGSVSDQVNSLLIQADSVFVVDRNKSKQYYSKILPFIENNNDAINYVIFQIRITEHLNHWYSKSSKLSSFDFVHSRSHISETLKAIDSVFTEKHINESSLVSKINTLQYNDYIKGLCYLALGLNSKYFKYDDQEGLKYFINAQNLLKTTTTGKCFLILSYKEAIQLAINNREYLLSKSFGENALKQVAYLKNDTLMYGIANIAAGYSSLSENLDKSLRNYLSAHELLRNSPYVFLDQEALKLLSHFHHSAGHANDHQFFLSQYKLSVNKYGDKMNIHKNLAQFACLEKDWKKAIEHFHLALKHYEKSGKREKSVQTTIYGWMVIAYKNVEEYDKAILTCLQQADLKVKTPIDLNNIEGMLNDSVLRRENNYILAYEISEILWLKYQKYKILEDLEFSLNFIKKCLANLSSPLNTIEESKKITAFSEFGDYFINHGLKVITELFVLTKDHKYLEAYLQNIEIFKGGILSGDLSTLFKKHKIPNETIKKEKTLHYKIEKNVLSNNLTNDSLQIWQNELKLIYNFYKTNYPKYIEERLQKQIPNISELQNFLHIDQALISYKIESNRVYKFTITKDDVCLTSEVFNMHELDSLIKLQQKTIGGNYKQLALKWYNILIPVSVREKQKFIIIPDGGLNKISFEALILPEKNLTYLIQNHYISVSPSINIFSRSKNKAKLLNNETPISIFSFSDKKTIKNQSNKFKELPGAYREVRIIEKSRIYKNIFYGSSATVSNFKNVYSNPETKIIHLATHGKAVNEQKNLAYLLFRNPYKIDDLDTLYTYDIESMYSNVKLVVLSACESHKGKIVNQEGLYSLSRSFLRNDADYVISALWNLDDVNTQSIIQEFYLSYGGTIQDRLRNAKLKKIHTSKDSQPYYWAGLVLIE